MKVLCHVIGKKRVCFAASMVFGEIKTSSVCLMCCVFQLYTENCIYDMLCMPNAHMCTGGHNKQDVV